MAWTDESTVTMLVASSSPHCCSHQRGRPTSGHCPCSHWRGRGFMLGILKLLSYFCRHWWLQWWGLYSYTSCQQWHCETQNTQWNSASRNIVGDRLQQKWSNETTVSSHAERVSGSVFSMCMWHCLCVASACQLRKLARANSGADRLHQTYTWCQIQALHTDPLSLR